MGCTNIIKNPRISTGANLTMQKKILAVTNILKKMCQARDLSVFFMMYKCFDCFWRVLIPISVMPTIRTAWTSKRFNAYTHNVFTRLVVEVMRVNVTVLALRPVL